MRNTRALFFTRTPFSAHPPPPASADTSCRPRPRRARTHVALAPKLARSRANSPISRSRDAPATTAAASIASRRPRVRAAATEISPRIFVKYFLLPASSPPPAAVKFEEIENDVPSLPKLRKCASNVYSVEIIKKMELAGERASLDPLTTSPCRPRGDAGCFFFWIFSRSFSNDATCHVCFPAPTAADAD